VIEIKDLHKTYPNGFNALNGINIHIGKDEFVYIVGSSGAGKSTLLRLLFKADSPTKGDIQIDRVSLNKMTSQQTPYLRRNIGVIFQDFKLLPKRTVYENIAFALRVMHYPRSRIRKQVMQVLDLVGLQQKMNSFPSELSGGEQQRICIARAIVNNPPILLADEPTGSLDPDTSWEIMQLLSKINSRQTTLIVATHDKAIVDDIRKRVITLENGCVAKDMQLGSYN
jgi:cell division transport system ATP-binding protein